MDSLSTIVGSHVRIKTTFGEEIEGEIFSYDTTTSCLVLVETQIHSTLKKNYRIFKTNFMKSIEYLGRSSMVVEDLPPVQISKIRSKEASTIRSLREEAQRIGVGVTKEAQEIFNSLSKTLPCRWKEDVIVVFDEIQIRPPYNATNCSGGDQNMLERVKKVLEGERKRLFKNNNN
eukprot:TRINITY_DN14281_c0_g1_i1.p1 TRINITY_DN14281_c0_g1~~TRINITY_DN14281_c0_g1_i1.p1  ORF type:complete len:175 (-),score=28.12 TRINITY_DN14281_c0_g1_i1:123-647(-)